MIKKISNESDRITIIRMDKGDIIFSTHLVPDGVNLLVNIEQTKNGSKKITALVDILLVVENLHHSGRGCQHVRFIRAERKDGLGLRFANPELWQKLRVALVYAEKSTFHAPGGFDRALIYQDERAVPNYSMAGANGWIILKNDINKYLSALPLLKDSGKIGFLWINHAGCIDTPEECSVQVVDHNPTGEKAPEYYDRYQGRYMSLNHQIFQVEYDEGSCIIKRIFNLTHKEECKKMSYKVNPYVRYVEVGRILPRELRK